MIKMYVFRVSRGTVLILILLKPFGFHLSDGTLYTYLDGDEYEDIAASWDWNCE